MVAPITAGKPSASATKAIAKASIMTVSPFCSCVKTPVQRRSEACRGLAAGDVTAITNWSIAIRSSRIAFLTAVLEHRLVAQECGDLRVPLELGHILRRGQFRLVARGIDHAEKAERLAAGGAELMPGHRRYGHEVAGLDRSDLLADQAVPAPAQDHDGMHVLVPLQGGEAAGRHLEIAQFAVQLRIGEQH